MSEQTDCFSTDDAAAYIRERHKRRCSSGYLMKLRSKGEGPRFYRRNGQIVYLRADLDDWAANPEVSGPFNNSREAREKRNRTLQPAKRTEVAVA